MTSNISEPIASWSVCFVQTVILNVVERIFSPRRCYRSDLAPLSVSSLTLFSPDSPSALFWCSLPVLFPRGERQVSWCSGAECFLSLIMNDLIRIVLDTWSEFSREKCCGDENVILIVFMWAVNVMLVVAACSLCSSLMILSACCKQFSAWIMFIVWSIFANMCGHSSTYLPRYRTIHKFHAKHSKKVHDNLRRESFIGQ